MDEEIRQLLHSLDTIEAGASRKIPESPQMIRIPSESACKQSCKKRNWRLGAGILVLVLSCVSVVGLYMTRQRETGPKRIVEASLAEGLMSNQFGRIRHIPIYCINDLSPLQEEGSASLISTQYDLTRFTCERIKNLEDISKNIRDVTTTIIASPDLSCHGALRRLIARFEQADVFHMNEVAPEIQERRSLLKTQKERQGFEAAMSCMGLGNIDAYQKRSDEISIASVLIDNCVTTLKSSKDVVSMAKIVRAATKLFNEMNTDTLACAIIDLKNREKEMFDAARVSTEKLIVSLLETKRTDDITKDERESIAYLYAVIPSMDPKVATALYEPPASKTVQKTFVAENNLGTSDPFVCTRTVYLASEGPCAGGL